MNALHRAVRGASPLPALLSLVGLAVVVLALALGVGQAWAQPVFTIRMGDLHGLIDARGQVLLAPEFTQLQVGEPLILARKGNRTAYFDRSGRMVIEPQSALTEPFVDGLSPSPGKDAQGKSRWGYADAGLALAIAPQWDQAEPFADGLAVVGVLDAWGC